MDLLKRVANYFAYEYQGDDKTAPEFKVGVDDLREEGKYLHMEFTI